MSEKKLIYKLVETYNLFVRLEEDMHDLLSGNEWFYTYPENTEGIAQIFLAKMGSFHDYETLKKLARYVCQSGKIILLAHNPISNRSYWLHLSYDGKGGYIEEKGSIGEIHLKGKS